MSINNVILSGHLTSNIELRSTASGSSVLEFSIAVDERKRDQKTGEWSTYANFFNCVMFGSRAESLSKIFEKGMKVAVSGHLRYESWEKDGQKRSSVRVVAEEVEIMSRRNGAESQGSGNVGNYTGQYQNEAQNASQAPAGYQYSVGDYFAEDVPF